MLQPSSEKTAEQLLSDLSYLKRTIKEYQEKEKQVTAQLKKMIEANDGQPIQTPYFKASIVQHSYALVGNDQNTNEKEAANALIDKLILAKKFDLVNVSLNTKGIAELVNKEHLATINLLDSVGLKIEERSKFDFTRL